MKSSEETPTAPPEGEPTPPETSGDAAPKAPEKPITPKEAEYQRSKDDLARKRRDLHRKGGRR